VHRLRRREHPVRRRLHGEVAARTAVGGRVSFRIGPRHLSVADQGLNSVSNFALVAFAAIASSTDAFGQFAVVYAFFIFFLGAQRALVGETALVHDSAVAEVSGPRRRSIVGASLIVAFPGAVAIAA